MLQGWHSSERMALAMYRQVHFVFGVVEATIDIPRREDQTDNLDEGAARKSE
jgi:hypothetical protein